jgi:hypothetical protein
MFVECHCYKAEIPKMAMEEHHVYAVAIVSFYFCGTALLVFIPKPERPSAT